MNKKLGIIIPYRNRFNHLKEFMIKFQIYMEKYDIPYEIFVVEQSEEKLFNRGKLLNVGFKYAEKSNCDYVIFHDVDMIPVNVDYSYSDYPIHLATNFVNVDKECDNYVGKVIFDEYFGGVTLFPMDDFRKINGYSNNYWGWGYEDNDLLLRCEKNEIKLDRLRIKNMGNPGKRLKFNGVNSYVKGNNIFNLNENCTFFISFYPNESVFDHEKDMDEFNVFTIPGYDFTISYNSFNRYTFYTFNSFKKVIYVNSNIKTNYITNMCVSIDNTNKRIRVYQDGCLIEEISFDNGIHSYEKEKYFYLGVGKPKRKDIIKEEYPKYFKGLISKFAYFNSMLTDEEIIEISENENIGENGFNKNLKLHYDVDHIKDNVLIDLTGNNNDGKIFNCDIFELLFQRFKIMKIPMRRESIFGLMCHKENGFYKNKWKFKATRWNQLKFHNEVRNNDYIAKNDGLSTLDFKEVELKKMSDKITHINVEF